MNAKLNKLIEQRYSPKAFSANKVEVEKVRLLIDAAKWAASSRNEQPWRFIIGERDRINHKNIFSTLTSSNQLWNEKVPLLIMTLIKKDSSYHGRPNFYAQHDLGLAIGNLCVQATYMGLHVHQMGGFDKEMATDAFSIPEQFIPMTVIAVGYIENKDGISDDLKKEDQQPRTRKTFDQIVFNDDWNKLI
ncbi:nitroreductase family protein [Sunxiuqinia sp. A32]|uniref:nitroreductase family protein n=1 Tax=Sunxiuqinia sp. A32 TaxID=3461496 RepID=UPI0040453A76